MAIEYFCAYHSYLKSMRNLSDAECGRLFRALLQYSAGDKSINLQGRESIAFDFITEQIDRDQAAYNEKCERNRENARKRSQTNVSDGKRSVTVADKKEKEKEKEKEKNTPLIPPRGEGGGVEAAFQKFWSVYPKKRNKADALKAFRSVIKSGVSLDALLSAVEAQRKTPQWTKDGGQYIPYPATWLNRGAWEDEDVVTVSSSAGYEYDPGDLTGSL